MMLMCAWRVPNAVARGGRLRQDSKRDITKKRNKFKFSYSRRAREISAFVARIVVLYKLKMQYHAHPSAMPMWYNVREDGCMKNYKTKSKFICKMHY